MKGITCVMPSANREDILPLAIRSYNEQTFQPRELIIIHNDPSPLPNSITKQLGEDVKVITYPKKMMAAIARNDGIKEAKYDYVAKCDDDDWYFPKRLEKMFQIMEEEPPLLGVAYSLLSAFDINSGRYGLVDKPKWYFDGSIMSRKKDLIFALDEALKNGGNPCPFKWLKDKLFREDIKRLGRIRDISQLLILFHGANDSTNWNYATDERTIDEFKRTFPDYVVNFILDLTEKRKKQIETK